MGNDITAGPGPLARVLVVDDSTVIRKAIEKKLKSDFDLCTAADGEAGWEALVRDDRISVLVTDIEMPGLDGYALVSRIRATEDVRLRDIPIIVITGAEDEESRERAFACGATDFIVKPIDTMQLRARVHAQARFSQTIALLNRTEEALKDQATFDPLTQLCSRRYFEQHCEQDIAYVHRHGGALTLARIEIDRLKEIYQLHGDQLVDELLVWAARIFLKVCRKEDTVARSSGAEFAVILPGSDKQQAMVLANRLCEATTAHPFQYGDVRIPVSVSIGLVTLGECAPGVFEELMALAERRLRRARLAGGNRFDAGEEAGALAGQGDLPALNPEQPVPEAVEEIEALSLPDTDELSTAGLEEIVRQEAEEIRASAPARGMAEPATADEIGLPSLPDTDELSIPGIGELTLLDAPAPEPVTVDEALRLLADGQGERIEPLLDGLVQRLLPLLEFHDSRRDHTLSDLLDEMRVRIRGSD